MPGPLLGPLRQQPALKELAQSKRFNCPRPHTFCAVEGEAGGACFKCLSRQDLHMGNRKSILIVEDERDLADMLAINLQRAGYVPRVVHSGRQALAVISADRPDLIILDLMLPELSGTEIARRVRAEPKTAGIPIIMVTAKTGELDQLTGLSIGADDYVTKPFSVKVLLARIEAVLRRATPGDAANRLQLGPLDIDLATHEARCHEQPMKLTLTEFRLLAALVQAQGRVLSRAVLMTRAMGPGVTVTERTIDVHITSIRKKLGPAAGLIRTVRGVGYRATTEGDGDAEDDQAAALLTSGLK